MLFVYVRDRTIGRWFRFAGWFPIQYLIDFPIIEFCHFAVIIRFPFTQFSISCSLFTVLPFQSVPYSLVFFFVVYFLNGSEYRTHQSRKKEKNRENVKNTVNWLKTQTNQNKGYSETERWEKKRRKFTKSIVEYKSWIKWCRITNS